MGWLKRAVMEKKMGEGKNRTRLEVEGLWSRGERGVNGKGSGSWDGRGVDWRWMKMGRVGQRRPIGGKGS